MPRRDIFKEITGKTRKQTFQRVNYKNTLDSLFKQTHSNYPLRSLGAATTDGTQLEISEEEREANFHIIGQPRQGKSKFIEYNIRKDIDMGNGLCLLDPSDNGDTAKKVLKYCALKGIEKVVYIDPDTLVKFGKIACLQPLKPYPYESQSVDSVMEALNNVFGVSVATATPRINTYLPALLSVLSDNNLTLAETKHFRLYQDAKSLPFLGFDEDSMIVKSAFRNPIAYENLWLPTLGRLNSFRKEPLSLMFGANTGIDFVKMIREGWVVLVNVHPGKSLTITQARLLGIMIISEIIHAVGVLFHAPTEGVIKKIFYLYMDEAGRFATPQITNLLDYMGKTGLRLVIAHHDFSQFKDKDVLTAIKNGCRIKMMFNISSYKDRYEMCEDLGYGGELHPLIASYVNQNIPRQEMVIKKDKETPVRIRVPDVSTITERDISQEEVDSYTEQLLEQPWCLEKKQITDQINARYETPRPPRNDTKTARPRTTSNRQSDSEPRVSNQRNDTDDKWKDVS